MDSDEDIVLKLKSDSLIRKKYYKRKYLTDKGGMRGEISWKLF